VSVSVSVHTGSAHTSGALDASMIIILVLTLVLTLTFLAFALLVCALALTFTFLAFALLVLAVTFGLTLIDLTLLDACNTPDQRQHAVCRCPGDFAHQLPLPWAG
jgi:hypothetical protein